jgi:polyene glycosyltransferase
MTNDMDRRPILFASLSARGLFNPLLTIAGELCRRGAPGVCFATDDDVRADVEGLAGATRAAFVSLGEPTRQLRPNSWDDDTYRAATSPSTLKGYVAYVLQILDAGSFADKYRRLDSEVERIRPSLMVVDVLTSYAVDVAMTRRIPFVLSVPIPVSGVFRPRLPRAYPAPFSGLPRKMTLSQQIANQLFRLRFSAIPLRPAIGALGVKYARTRRQLGIDGGGVMAKIDAARAVFGYSVFGLEYPFPAPAKLRMLGAMVPPLPQGAPDPALSTWLAAHPSIVYMGFGTITRLDRSQVHALVGVARRMSGRHAVLWKLPRAQQALLPPAGELPGNLRIEDWLPSQLDVLAHPHVRAFFTHGGGNGFHEGIYFGKPLLVLPLWLDCHDLAARAVDSGVGLVLERRDPVDPGEIAAKLTRVLTEDSFRARAEHWARRQREAGGVGAAADLLLEYAGRALPSTAEVSA